MLKRILAALLALSVLATTVGTAAAQTSAGGQGFEISPSLIEQTAVPGKQLTLSIRIRNITKGTLVAHAAVNDFVANGETGQAKVLVDQSQPSAFSFRNWVQTIPDATLAAGDSKTESVTITVPQNASPGGHYGVIRFTGTSPGLSGTGVSLTASIGTLVLLTVPGKITIDASLVDFYAAKASSTSAKHSMFEYGPVGFVERVQNKGNEHIQPNGTVTITNMLGHPTAALSINPTGGNILPDSIRRFDQTLNKKNLFGRYTAQANIQFNGKTLTRSIHFWVIPYRLILIALGVLVVVVALIRMWVKKSAERIVRKSSTSSPKNPKRKTKS